MYEDKMIFDMKFENWSKFIPNIWVVKVFHNDYPILVFKVEGSTFEEIKVKAQDHFKNVLTFVTKNITKGWDK